MTKEYLLEHDNCRFRFKCKNARNSQTINNYTNGQNDNNNSVPKINIKSQKQRFNYKDNKYYYINTDPINSYHNKPIMSKNKINKTF